MGEKILRLMVSSFFIPLSLSDRFPGLQKRKSRIPHDVVLSMPVRVGGTPLEVPPGSMPSNSMKIRFRYLCFPPSANMASHLGLPALASSYIAWQACRRHRPKSPQPGPQRSGAWSFRVRGHDATSGTSTPAHPPFTLQPSTAATAATTTRSGSYRPRTRSCHRCLQVGCWDAQSLLADVASLFKPHAGASAGAGSSPGATVEYFEGYGAEAYHHADIYVEST
jgi:hypothetical protein